MVARGDSSILFPQERSRSRGKRKDNLRTSTRGCVPWSEATIRMPRRVQAELEEGDQIDQKIRAADERWHIHGLSHMPEENGPAITW